LQRRSIELTLFTLLLIFLFFCIQEHVFFWDTIQLGAKHAWYYYETGFSRLLLPENIDSGHPPLLGLLLAAAWSLFGRTLEVSHWLMFPFVWGIGWMLFRLGDIFLGKKWAFAAVLLCLPDPVLAGQSILISPDLILVFGFLLGWLAILKRHPYLKIPAALLLAAISTRGMMVVVVLYLLDLWAQWDDSGKNKFLFFIKMALPYVPSGLLALAFLTYHYIQTGWIGYHADSPWAPGFERVGLGGFFKNVLVLGWKMLDFGRVFIWLLLLVVLVKKRFNFKNLSTDQKRVWRLFLLTTLFLSITFLTYSGLHGHRYLLPAFIALNFVFLVEVKKRLASVRWKTAFFALGVAGFVFGNTWIYPDKVSQGWDSTLAHWPYYELRGDMLAFLEKNDIPLESIGTAFPEIGPLKYKDLSGREEGMVEKDLKQQSYILYSNVMNDFSDEEIDTLKEEWEVVKKMEKRGVKVVLFIQKMR